jgi:hypothetical protein
MESRGSLPCSQEPFTSSYPEPVELSPYHPSHFSKINLNVILPPTSVSSWWFLSFWLSHRNLKCIHLLPHAFYMPWPSCPPWLDHSKLIWRTAQALKLLTLQLAPISFYLIPLRSSWLQIQMSRVRFPALPDFLASGGSGTGSTQSREHNWGATWMEK